jgi:acetyl-CoA carboxylase biotin carboxylase subunit
VRLDTHVYAGYRVPPFYDSLLAKLIVSGNSREEAIVRARNALGSFVIEGVPTTIPFLAKVARDDHFVRGDVHTGFVDRFMDEQEEDAAE